MTVAEQTKEVVELAAGYVNEMVTALTPIAKQAYEIGLVTLQVDAGATLFYGFLGCLPVLVTVAVCIWIFKTRHINDSDRVDCAGMVAAIGGVISFMSMLFVGYKILSVWTWVKLFSPELWLAHQAVEKLLK